MGALRILQPWEKSVIRFSQGLASMASQAPTVAMPPMPATPATLAAASAHAPRQQISKAAMAALLSSHIHFTHAVYSPLHQGAL